MQGFFALIILTFNINDQALGEKIHILVKCGMSACMSRRQEFWKAIQGMVKDGANGDGGRGHGKYRSGDEGNGGDLGKYSCKLQ